MKNKRNMRENVAAMLLIIFAIVLIAIALVADVCAEPAESFILYDVPLDDDLQQYIWAECQDRGVPVELVLGVIQKESNFKADALGDYGRSVGLMQIQPQWQKARMEYLGCWNLMDPYDNVRCGIDILAELLTKYQDTEKALMVYNAGETGAKKGWFYAGIYSNTYSRAVLANAAALEPKTMVYCTAEQNEYICDHCDNQIGGEYMYVIGNEDLCELCLIVKYRKEIS